MTDRGILFPSGPSYSLATQNVPFALFRLVASGVHSQQPVTGLPNVYLKNAIPQGKLIALSGIIGCGKTKTFKLIQDELIKEKKIVVSRSLAVDKDRVNLGTLMMAMFYDLATEKDLIIPTAPEKRERKLLELIKKRKRPIALFIDEAHDLHSKTLIGIKRIMELVYSQEDTLSVVLAGHPKLKNDLRRPAMEEIGSRAMVLDLEGVQGHQRDYIEWLLQRCTEANLDELIETESITLLAESLRTPLQIELYLTLAFEKAFHVGQKPIAPKIIESVLAKGLDDLEPTLTRYGYNTRAISSLLDVRISDVRAFLRGRLPAERSQEFRNELRAAGVPL